ncbi:MAG: iron-sulfur cluster insertion protein ErpA [Alicyclobacillaceae bacterium]|nr:iron-sulfur cluster insertion protein ErpA [Alicyclobacillaceae bacterium]
MVTLTQGAADKLKSIMADKGREDLAVRVFIKAGGCSGFSYGMALDEPKDDDQVVETSGIRVVIDPMSARYLQGAEIDYVDSLMGAGFKIHNPNAVSTCGCGSSFRTADDAGQPGTCGH